LPIGYLIASAPSVTFPNTSVFIIYLTNESTRVVNSFFVPFFNFMWVAF
jgi:hypothetical protein